MQINIFCFLGFNLLFCLGFRSSTYSFLNLRSGRTFRWNELMERRVNDEIVNIAPTDTNDPSNKSWQETFKLVNELLFLEPYASNVVNLCDRIDATAEGSKERFLLRLSRQWLLTQILIRSRDEYISLVTLLIKRIPRSELPNLQDIPYDLSSKIVKPIYETNNDFVPDCELPTIKYQDSILDDILLKIFRVMVREEINYESTTKGIRGLLEEGKHFMLSEQGTPENQHAFVKRVLAGLLTPFLPPFYRIFMSGIIPCKENNDPDWLVNLSNSFIDIFPESIKKDLKSGKQLGPWFYAPALTSFVTPPFMSFLLGPSRPNRRKDGKLGGMVVEKCKFLQESGCKGLCLHQCKIPAQQFFNETLGLPLTVSPNFATQECQWSWGEVPLPYEEDPSFPKKCLVGCPTRMEINEKSLVLKSSCG